MFGVPMIFIKIGAALALFAALLFAGHQVAEHWREQGRSEVMVKWDADKAERELAQKTAIDLRTKENTTAIAANELKNQETVDDLHTKLEKARQDNRAGVADIIAHGGLRISADYCAGFASKAEAQSPERNHGEGGTRLPQQIEDRLFDYADERDKEIIQLGKCQDWIVENGFYP